MVEDRITKKLEAHFLKTVKFLDAAIESTTEFVPRKWMGTMFSEIPLQGVIERRGSCWLAEIARVGVRRG